MDGVLREARRFSRHILVVDDGSTDGTARLLSRHDGLHVIRHETNRGYGRSLADALAFAQRGRFPWLVTMDCDGQHEAPSIARFLSAAARNRADIISGTRYPNGFDVNGAAPPARRAINRRITAMLNDRLGLSLTDAFCGFKAYRVSSLCHFRITEWGYAMPLQLWVQAARAELTIRELPVPLIYNDPARRFGGVLDEPAVRLRHYVAALEAAMAETTLAAAPCRSDCLPCP